MRKILLFVVLSLVGAVAPSHAAVSGNKEMPRMENPSLSPDGRYVAYLARDTAGKVAVETIDLDGDDARHRAIDSSAFDGQGLDWWGWANSDLLLCGLHQGKRSTILAVNADGSGRRVLMKHEARSDDPDLRPQVIDWLPREPQYVLLRLQGPSEAFPSAQQIDVIDGTRKVRVPAQPPIRHFRTDRFGEVRFGWGADENGAMVGFSRLGEAKLFRPLKWKRLTRLRVPPRVTSLEPMPVFVDVMGHLPAVGRRGGNDAIWWLDLNDEEEPRPNTWADGTHAFQTLVTPRGEFLGLQMSGGERPQVWYEAGADNVGERVAKELGVDAVKVAVIDRVDNPSRYLVRAKRGTEPTRLYLYGIAGGPFELREIGRLDGAPMPAPAPTAVASTPAASTGGGDTLDLLVTVTEPGTKKPVKGLPVRIVLSSDPDWRSPDAGKRYVTDDKGRVRDSRPIRLESKRVNLDIPLVTHGAVGFDFGIEIHTGGMPLLYTLTLDEVKRAHGTLISDTQVYTRDDKGRYTREVDFSWHGTNEAVGGSYGIPPRAPKTFERLPDPPPFRLTERNLQLLPHPRADGTTRWAFDLRLTLDPYRPREGG